MRRSKVLAWLVLAAFGITSCKTYINWNSHASYRTTRGDLKLAHIDPTELVEGVISANLHYVSVALDTVFVRNLPGLFKRSVAFGVEITGILSEGKAIKTVLDVKDSVGEHAFLSFDNVAVIEPFLYTGQNITIGLHFKAVAGEMAAQTKGRIQGAGDAMKKINPLKTQALNAGDDLFLGIIKALTSGEKSWSYQFTLYPADSVYRDKPEMLFTASRHILLSVPPANAPKEMRLKYMPSRLIGQLKMRGNRLIWANTEEEYTATPYIVLNVTRFKRYPNPDTPLRKLAKTIDNLFEQGSLELARANLPLLGKSINEDPVITQLERNLERSWKDYREARLLAAESNKKGDAQEELRQHQLMLKHMTVIRDQFQAILYPYEIKDIDYKVNQLMVRAEELVKQMNVPLTEIASLVDTYKLKVKKAQERIKKEEAEAREVAEKIAADLAKRGGIVETRPAEADPIHKKWWFWTIVVAALGGGGAGVYLGTRSAPASTTPPGVIIPFQQTLSGP